MRDSKLNKHVKAILEVVTRSHYLAPGHEHDHRISRQQRPIFPLKRFSFSFQDSKSFCLPSNVSATNTSNGSMSHSRASVCTVDALVTTVHLPPKQPVRPYQPTRRAPVPVHRLPAGTPKKKKLSQNEERYEWLWTSNAAQCDDGVQSRMSPKLLQMLDLCVERQSRSACMYVLSSIHQTMFA